MFFSNPADLYFTLGFVNTTVALEMFRFIAPTLNLTAGNMNKLPIISNGEKEEVVGQLVESNIEFAKRDWDAYENSWDFKRNPLV